MTSPKEILQKYWQYDSFRPLQSEIISSVLEKKDTLALMPTGGGKSLCFQVPGLILDGVTIVITPLIALMKDQVYQLKERNIRAAAIFSGMHKSDIDRTLDNFVLGDYKFLYVSPERLLTEMMIERTKRMNVSLLVIDEAHCISKWGHDFRPSYLKINTFKQYCPKASIIALTATATKETQKDILAQLKLKRPEVFKMSFKRSNLAIYSSESSSKNLELADLINKVRGSSIVYCKTRKDTQEVAHFLKNCGLSADFYHAGLSNELRFKKQEDWIKNKIQIIVSTNAFGMGIDKSDVRSVFHLHIPENMESYYQEIGRAGRDGADSSVFLLYNNQDIEKLKFNLEQAFPPIELLVKLYQSLCNFYKLAYGSIPEQYYEFDSYHFQSTFGLKAIPTYYGMKMLENQGIIEMNDSYQAPSRFQFLINSFELGSLQDKNKDLEKFTQTLLRIYGGELFLNPSIISESEISKAYGAGKIIVERMLRRLEKLNIGSYFQQSGKPTISFLGKRYDAEKLPLNHSEIAKKKKSEKAAIERMINYVSGHRRCRMAQLQDYFGEENVADCGQCDICKLKNEETLRIQKIESLGVELAKQLPIQLSELTLKSETTTFGIEEVIHHFVDRNYWILQNGVLKVNSKN
ncbi:RecQ family ATP-dependent DNA helicase [Arcticibacterium luteifluviistationis]|uniref:ATP-dependent DNA helicase RecQ n=1 Tax=Arcticibacterium luteifluviistationis TaxID=1784714 RepID=A0A2Z4GBH8_9BACT|nr:ATP-dependent DNA helicase RecQ [Arcticibacterium luteifluviistationis]AWV98649.1 RecQ family ATP-dependent DNA helicase [Arcticibacterium luteifluviistationis]